MINDLETCEALRYCARIKCVILTVCVAAVLFSVSQALGQLCPHGPIDIAGLTAQTETTKDPNVIFRSAALAGQAVVPTLKMLSKPDMSPETVAGAAQASLAKLGYEPALVELDGELNRREVGHLVWAIEKLPIVNNPRAISMLVR